MEINEPARQIGKAKSRLLAMKSRLRERQKREALAARAATGGEMAKCAGKPPLVGDGLRRTTRAPQRHRRSHTSEGCLADGKSEDSVVVVVVGATNGRRTRRSNTAEATLGEMGQVKGEEPGGARPDGRSGERRDEENARYGSLPAKYLRTGARGAGEQAAAECGLGFQRSASLDDADRKLARGQYCAPLMGSKAMATRHGSLSQIPNAALPRPSGLERGRTPGMTSSHGHIPGQVNQQQQQQRGRGEDLARKPNSAVQHPQNQYVLFRSRGLPRADGADSRKNFKEKHLSKSMDDLTEVRRSADVSRVSAESDPSDSIALRTGDREAYQREWAACKPRAVLVGREDAGDTARQPAGGRAPAPVVGASRQPSGKGRFRDFFAMRRGRPSRAEECPRSETTDHREHLAIYGKAARLLGSDPALFTGDGQGRARADDGDRGRVKGRVRSRDQSALAADPKPSREDTRPAAPRADDGVKGQSAGQGSRSTCEPARKIRADGTGNRRKSNLKVTNPEDMKYQRSALGGSNVAVSEDECSVQMYRRHTASVPNLNQRSKQKAVVDEKDAFLDLLASRYPDHAHTIKAVKEWERPSDASRRRTTQVVHVMPEGSVGPRPMSQDSRMMAARDEEDSPTGTFTRGGRLRSSLPVVRSPNKSLERPMGLVFLTFRSETKRALLPNEVTSLDTVRALFVRSFSECLSMQWFDIPSHKIYILDHKTNVFYELDDVREVKDRAVLKIYETGLPPPAPGSPTPHSPQAPDYLTLHQHHAGYESDSSIRSAPSGPGVPGTGVRSPLHHPPLSPRLYQPAKAQTIAGHNGTYSCPQQIKNTYATPYAPGQHPPSQLSLGQPQQAASSHWSPTLHTHQHIASVTQRPDGQYSITPSNQSSPQRVQHVHQAVASNQRHSLACLPDPNTYSDGRISQSRSYHDYPNGAPPPSHTSGTATPTHTDSEAKSRMDHMEAQLANLAAWVQTTVMKNQSDGSRPGSARSNSSMMSEGSYSAKSKSESTTPLQSPASSSRQGMSDISSATPQPMISVDMQNTIRSLHYHTRDLRSEVNKLRRLQMTNMETMRESIHDTYKKLKEVIEFVPNATDQPVRVQRHQINYKVKDYKDDGRMITQDLIDLEKSVEELRNDVLNRKCRVNVTEIENMALALSNIAKSLGELKAHFPALQEEMKAVMQGEMKIVVEEEKFIRDEPDKLDNSLKRCKKLTGTLATLRRLAIVQEHNDPVAPVIPALESNEGDHLAILEEIKCMVPDHNARLTSVQAAEGARERKKKLDSRGESLRFEKSLALAHRHLKEAPGNGKNRPAAGLQPLKEESSSAEKASQEGSAKCDKKCDDVKVSSAKQQLNEESFLAHCKDEENYISALRLSAFENSSSANGDSLHDGAVRSKALSPAWTSTPKDHNHAVVGSGSAESSLSPLTTSGHDGKKKVPPPPPPRRSSRSSMKSPVPTNQKASVNFTEEEQSLHMYENLDELNASETAEKGKDAAKEQGTLGSPGPHLPRPKSASDVPASEITPPKERPKSQYSPTKSKNSPTKSRFSPKEGQTSSPTRNQYSPTKMKKLNKFQQELAAGIYSNLNRPDLQQQKVNAALLVQDATSPDSSSSNSSSSTSLDSQLGGTIKRNKNIKFDDKPPGGGTEQKKSPTGKARKVPPPPPQRKTSALSQQKDGPPMSEQQKPATKAEQAGDGDNRKDASRSQSQHDRMKIAQKDYVQKQLHDGGGARLGTCVAAPGEENSGANATNRTKDVNGAQPAVGKSVSSGQPQLAQVQPAGAVRLGQAQGGVAQLGAKQAGQSQTAVSKTVASCSTAKLAAVSNGDVSKTATKSCSVKVEVRANRKFEETEIY